MKSVERDLARMEEARRDLGLGPAEMRQPSEFGSGMPGYEAVPLKEGRDRAAVPQPPASARSGLSPAATAGRAFRTARRSPMAGARAGIAAVRGGRPPTVDREASANIGSITSTEIGGNTQINGTLGGSVAGALVGGLLGSCQWERHRCRDRKPSHPCAAHPRRIDRHGMAGCADQSPSRSGGAPSAQRRPDRPGTARAPRDPGEVPCGPAEQGTWRDFGPARAID